MNEQPSSFAVIQNGIVTNIALAHAPFAAEQGWIAAPDSVSIGWAYDGADFTAPTPPPIEPALIDVERDRRIAAGFVFNGVLYQSRAIDQKRINGAATLALAAIVSGAQPGNLRWANPDSDFEWIATDNSRHSMDAQTVMAFAGVAAAWESAHVFAANDLKAMAPIPADYAADEYWP